MTYNRYNCGWNVASPLISCPCKSVHSFWIILLVPSLLMNRTDVKVGRADVKKQVLDQAGKFKQMTFHLSCKRTDVRLQRFSAIRAPTYCEEEFLRDILKTSQMKEPESFRTYALKFLLAAKCKIWKTYIRSHPRLRGRGTRDRQKEDLI